MPKAMKPAEGYDWNPLFNLPRNMPCPCDSKLKFKQCCWKIMPKVVTTSLAREYRAALKTPAKIRFQLETPTQSDIPFRERQMPEEATV